jgi:hypothetical protein
MSSGTWRGIDGSMTVEDRFGQLKFNICRSFGHRCGSTEVAVTFYMGGNLAKQSEQVLL